MYWKPLQPWNEPLEYHRRHVQNDQNQQSIPHPDSNIVSVWSIKNTVGSNMARSTAHQTSNKHAMHDPEQHTFSSMKFKQPSLGTKAVIFLPFLINWTRMHLRIAELGCLASIPLYQKVCEHQLTWLLTNVSLTSFQEQFPWRGKHHQMGLPLVQFPSGPSCMICRSIFGCDVLYAICGLCPNHLAYCKSGVRWCLKHDDAKRETYPMLMRDEDRERESRVGSLVIAGSGKNRRIRKVGQLPGLLFAPTETRVGRNCWEELFAKEFTQEATGILILAQFACTFHNGKSRGGTLS